MSDLPVKEMMSWWVESDQRSRRSIQEFGNGYGVSDWLDSTIFVDLVGNFLLFYIYDTHDLHRRYVLELYWLNDFDDFASNSSRFRLDLIVNTQNRSSSISRNVSYYSSGHVFYRLWCLLDTSRMWQCEDCEISTPSVIHAHSLRALGCNLLTDAANLYPSCLVFGVRRREARYRIKDS